MRDYRVLAIAAGNNVNDVVDDTVAVYSVSYCVATVVHYCYSHKPAFVLQSLYIITRQLCLHGVTLQVTVEW